MADRTFTAEEQASINALVPGIQWINGKPFTTQTSTPEEGEVDYLGNPVEATSEIVPASTKPDAFPWWALAGMAAGPALAAGAGAGLGALGGAGGGAGAAGATGALGSVPIGGAGALSTAGMLAPSAIGIGAPAAAGGAAAAGGGGGFLSALTGSGGKMGAIGNIGRVASGAAEASAQNDQNKALLNQNRSQLQSNQFQTQQQAQMQGGNLDLQRKQFESGEEGTRLRRALLGQLFGNAQALDINLPGVPKAQVSGGLSFNSLGQGGRDTGALMTARALQQLARGNQFQGGQILTPPPVPEVGRTGGNKFLNVLGTLGSMAGGLPPATNPGTR